MKPKTSKVEKKVVKIETELSTKDLEKIVGAGGGVPGRPILNK